MTPTPAPPPPAASPPRRPWRTAAACGLLVLLTAVAYAPVYRFGFVPFDDQDMIWGEPHIRGGVTAGNVRWAITSFDTGPWMPLERLSYMADSQWFGFNTSVMHAEDVAMHAAAVVFLFLFFAKATGRVARSGVAAAVFAVHPMHVESVAWLAERRDVQCLALFAASLWAYARYARAGPRRGRVAYGLAVALFAGAVVAKATAMAGPVLLLLADAWPLRRWRASDDRAARLRLVLEKLPFAAVAVPVAALAAHGLHAAGATSSLAAQPIPARLANMLVTTALYLWKLAIPVRLSAIYLPPVGGWPPGPVLAATAALAAAAALAHRVRRRAPYVAIGLAWFAVALLPVSGVAQAGYHSMADRYSYLPSIGVTAAAVWAAADLVRAGLASPVGRRRASVAAATVAVVTLTILCQRQVGYWRGGRALFAHAAAVTDDSWFAEYQLGLCDAGDGNYSSAMARFTHVLQLNPEYPEAWVDLGNCVVLVDPNRAVDIYRQALALHPLGRPAARACANLGNAYLALHRPDDAASAFTQALRFDPASGYARQRLAEASKGAAHGGTPQ